MNNVMDPSRPAQTIRCWVDLYSAAMLSWAYHKTGNQHTAEDLVQDTFFSAVKSFDRFRGDSEPKTWLFSILNNKIADHYRKVLKTPVSRDEDFLSQFFDENEQWQKEAAPRSWPESEELLDNHEFQQTLQQCMQKLPSQWLMVIQLKYLQGKNGAEICKDLEISPSNFWQLVHRAKLQLRKCLEHNWFNI